jgi:hypothetical protein
MDQMLAHLLYFGGLPAMPTPTPMPKPICSRCRGVVIPDDGGAVVTIQKIGGREEKRLVCATCAERIVEAMRDRAAELAAAEASG